MDFASLAEGGQGIEDFLDACTAGGFEGGSDLLCGLIGGGAQDVFDGADLRSSWFLRLRA